MSQKLRAFVAWINGQSFRERLLLLGVASVAVFMFWDLVLMGPLRTRETGLQDTLESLRAAGSAIEQETSRLAAELDIDPNEDTRSRTSYLGRQIAQLDSRLEKRTYDLIPPAEMASVLRELLRRQSELRLIRLESLPVEPLFEDPEGRESEDDPDRAAQVYRHGVEMELQGGYLSTLRYLEALEELPWRFFFESLEYEVLEYPEARITLRVHTVSMQEGWIGV